MSFNRQVETAVDGHLGHVIDEVIKQESAHHLHTLRSNSHLEERHILPNVRVARETSGHKDSHQSEKRTFDGGVAADHNTACSNARLVGRIARQLGVNPVTAVATMLVESGGNHHCVGDHGTSFGLFQLHRGVELGSLSMHDAFNPILNASVALQEFQKNEGRYRTPGEVAAASQRPRNRLAYARRVNESLDEARRLLEEA